MKKQVIVKPDESGAAKALGKNNKYAVNQVCHTVMAKPKGEEDLPLPQGWKEVKDPKSGKTYYYHKDTKKTSWKRPRLEVEEEERY